MPTRFDLIRRLEPRRPARDLNDGLAAPLADPLWLLGRQWQLGEHQAEDAASPVRVKLRASSQPLGPPLDRPSADLTTTPAEAIVESEPEDWWTPGRRVRVGRQAAPFIPGVHPELLLKDLPPPYEEHSGSGYDGRLVFEQRAALGLPAHLFTEVAADTGHHWSASELYYSTAFPCGGAQLEVTRHDGGDVDWWTVDASGTLAPTTPPERSILPNRFRYPGAPHPRWWQIEDARLDPGGYPPDRSHFGTMLLLDLLSSHDNDWYLFPVDAEMGSVVTLEEVTVVDACGQDWTLQPPTDWSLFRVRGLGSTSLLLALTVPTPIVGDPVEDVALGIDEDANAVWAVEQRAGGRALVTTPPNREQTLEPLEPLEPGQPAYEYRPTLEVPQHWHPYVIRELNGERWLVQGRLAELSTSPATLRPEPLTDLLRDPEAPPTGPAHRLDPSAIPSHGLRLERRWILGRRTDGSPVLWSQRRRIPLLSPPVHQLRFDVLQERPTGV